MAVTSHGNLVVELQRTLEAVLMGNRLGLVPCLQLQAAGAAAVSVSLKTGLIRLLG